MRFRIFHILLFISCLFSVDADELCALDTLRVRVAEGEKTYVGRILFDGPEEKVVLQTRDGQLFLFDEEEILHRETDERSFKPLTNEEISRELREEFGETFSVHVSDHYVIVYNTSQQYAQWCGQLLDRIFEKYQAVWKKFGLEISEPLFPLVAVIFEEKKQFNDYGTKTLGDSFHVMMNAYYHPYTNRIVLCDLSGIEARYEGKDRKVTSSQIRAILSRPGAGRNVSAIMHEAAHQIGFNDGMFPRLSKVPIWLCEGVAVMHELPDIQNPRTNENGDPGKVNRKSLQQFRAYMETSPTDPVRTLIRSDERILTIRSASGNYGLAWALSYYLYKRKPAEFRRYLKMMTEKEMFVVYSAEERLADFETCFGNDWTKFHRDFAKFVRGLK